jgi:hypothetical protein
VTKAAEKDSVLFEILRDTTKDAIKKGGDKLTELGLDRFKGEGPSDGFQPNGWSVARYRKLLNDGITDRARVLTRIAKFLENAADAFTPELAEAMSDGMLKNDFFDDANRIHIKDEDLLERKAELALWCAWALVRDEDYWQKQKSLAGYGPNMSEVFDFRPVLERVIELGVPKEAVTIDLNPYKIGSKKATGLDVIGFMDWAKSPDMVHTLYEGISIAGGDPHHFGISRMRDVVTLSNTAA